MKLIISISGWSFLKCVHDIYQLSFGFVFAPFSGTALTTSVLCCTSGVSHFVFASNLILLDCFFSSSVSLWDLSLRRHASTFLLMNCSSRNSTVFYVVCVCSCGTSFIACDRPFQNRQWHAQIDDLFVHSLCRELRLLTTVFADVVDVAQRLT